jgi:O-antigen ligase
MTATIDRPTRPSADTSRASALAVAGIVLFLCVAYLPDLDHWAYVTRMAIVLPVAGWGLVELGRLLRRGDRPAAFVAALMVWGLFASLVSPEPWLATVAGFINDRQWLYQAATLACWAVGRRVRPSDRPLIIGALLVGLAANVVFAIAQASVEGYGLLQLSEGRALGFQASPVFLGGLMTGALVLCASLVTSSRSWWWTALVGVSLATLAADLSGSRSALLLGIPLALVAARRSGWRRLGLIVLAVVVGLVLSSAILGAGSTSARRLGGDQGGGGIAPRVTMWEAGVRAAAERPLTGWGVGRFRSATTPRTTPAFVRAEGPDREYFDAHNLFVEQLVAVGIPGLVLLVGFGWSLRRRVEGPLAWFAAGVAVTWLLEPISIGTGPLVMLALGASFVRTTNAEDGEAVGAEADALAPARRRLLSAAVPVLIGLFVLAGAVQGARLLMTGRDLLDAQTEASPAAIERVRSRFPRDASLADTASIIAVANTHGDRTSPAARRALAQARRATQLEPSRAQWWARRAGSEQYYSAGTKRERLARAHRVLLRGYERNPWSAQVLYGLYENAAARHDRAEEARWRADLCRIDLCPTQDAEQPGG